MGREPMPIRALRKLQFRFPNAALSCGEKQKPRPLSKPGFVLNAGVAYFGVVGAGAGATGGFGGGAGAASGGALITSSVPGAGLIGFGAEGADGADGAGGAGGALAA